MKHLPFAAKIHAILVSLKRLGLVILAIAFGLAMAPITPAQAAQPPIIAASNVHTCAITGFEGGVVCWGSSYFSTPTLGSASPLNSIAPVPVPGLTGVVALAAGIGFTCALTSAGGVSCWGYNYSGELGDGSFVDRATPVAVNGFSAAVVKIAAGSDHICALLVTGTLQCWGYNETSQFGLGIDDRTSRAVPTTVPGLAGVSDVAGGAFGTCAIVGGNLKCWGSRNTSDSTVNLNYVGNGSTWGAFSPVDIPGVGTGVRSVAIGFNTTCAVTAVGGVMCWGQNNSATLAVGSSDFGRIEKFPAQTTITSGAVQVVAHASTFCALMSDGSAKCWGDNSSVQLAVAGTGGYVETPTTMPFASAVAAIAPGRNHLCAVLVTGAVQCVGNDGTTPRTGVLTNVSGDLKLGLTVLMTEYVVPSLDYYFLTSRQNEKVLLDGLTSFKRTGKSFPVLAVNAANSVGISRYYFDQVAKGGARGSHFYTLVASEKSALDGLNPTNAKLPKLPQNEGVDSFAFAPAVEGVGGSCAAGQTPVYRAFRGSKFVDDANHRFTTDLALYSAIVASGWDGEGVKFCVNAP